MKQLASMAEFSTDTETLKQGDSSRNPEALSLRDGVNSLGDDVAVPALGLDSFS
jgi:hypothetical protein